MADVSAEPGRDRVVAFGAGARRFAADRLQKVGLFSSDELFVDLYCLEPGQSQKPHAHVESAKVYLVLEGCGVATLGEREFMLEPGQSVMAEPGEVHGLRNGGPDRLVALTVMAPPPR